MTKIGFSNLRNYQYAHNLTGEELAKKLLVSRTYILGVLSGKYFPSQGLQYRIRELLSTWKPSAHLVEEEKNDTTDNTKINHDATSETLVVVKKNEKLNEKLMHQKSSKVVLR